MPSDCKKCGSPYQPGAILCRFCRSAFDEEEARRATPCPKCKDLFSPSTQRCPRCEVWLVVQCVFCEGLSPYTYRECDGCGEVFAGAPARKAARDAAGGSWPAHGWDPSGSDRSGGLPWPGASQGGSSDFAAWGAAPPSGEQQASDLFSSFGQKKGPSDEKAPGWDASSWGGPKRRGLDRVGVWLL